MRKVFLCFSYLALVVGSRAQNLGFNLIHGGTKVVIPIEIHDNLIVVPVKLNGQLPLRFILDTGVRTTILTEKAFSDFLHLTYARKYTIAGPGGDKLIDAYVANNVSIDLPGVHGEGHAILVLDKDYLELRNYLGVDVHGILGYELFSRFVVEINYQFKTLTLMLPKRFKPGRKLLPIPITIEDTKPYVWADIHFNDSSTFHGKFLIDTGASHGLLLDPATDSLIRVPKKHIENIIGRGLGGVITGQVARIKSMDIGTFSMQNVIANFPDPNSYSDSIKGNKDTFRNGSIGGEILNRFKVVFDFPNEKVYLKKNASFRKSFHYNMSGITIKAQGQSLHEFIITNVRSNSAASRANLRVGDIILSIGEYTAQDLDISRIENSLNKQPGNIIIMEIERDAQKFRISFVLENPI